MTSENRAPDERRWGRSPALAVGIGILGAIAWLVFWWTAFSWIAKDFGPSRDYYARGLKACRWELALRTAAVQRFAQRTGHLPGSLRECEKDFIRAEDAFPESFRYMIEEPRYPGAAKPSVWQDFLGLPIIYTRGQQSADESRFLSSEPIPPELELYLKEHGGIPAASPEPFALSSLFMRDVLRNLRSQELKELISLYLLWGGLVIITVGTVILAKKWRRFGSSTVGRVLLGVSLFSVLLGLLFPSISTCYVRAFFHSRSVSMEKRLRILDDAVKHGEVSEEVAKTARSHIRKMFGDIEE